MYFSNNFYRVVSANPSKPWIRITQDGSITTEKYILSNFLKRVVTMMCLSTSDNILFKLVKEI